MIRAFLKISNLVYQITTYFTGGKPPHPGPTPTPVTSDDCSFTYGDGSYLSIGYYQNSQNVVYNVSVV